MKKNKTILFNFFYLKDFIFCNYICKCKSYEIKGYQKKCDLVTYSLSFLQTDKVIHRGAPLLKRIMLHLTILACSIGNGLSRMFVEKHTE